MIETPFIKICGITTYEDAKIAIDSGATALGFNFYSKSPRFLEVQKAKELAGKINSEISLVAVFVNESLETVKKIHNEIRFNYLQFHGDEDAAYVNSFDSVIKAFRIKNSLNEELLASCNCSALLFDAHSEKEYGGTGMTFDWTLAKQYSKKYPLILAGGLHSENIASAILQVQPAGVDVSSGVEVFPGKKDKIKTMKFIQEARKAFERIQ